MSENSKIEWTDHTFNPWEGCQKVGPGCDHCYAEARNARFGGGQATNWGPGAPRRRTSAKNWYTPFYWNDKARAFMAEHGRRQRVFCASLADVFDNAVPIEWFVDLLELINATSGLDWLLLTKRIGNAKGRISEALAYVQEQPAKGNLAHWLTCWLDGDEPPANVWLGATVVNQAEADRDIPKLLATPAALRFLSMEPLIGPVDISKYLWPVCGWWKPPHRSYSEAKAAGGECGLKRQAMVSARSRFVDWVIVGGESGTGARPMHPDWVRMLRDQCAAAGIPFLFKQWGEWRPISDMAEAEHRSLYRSRVKARSHESQEAIDDSYGKSCTVACGMVHLDGSLHGITEPMACLQGTGAMQTFQVGKKAAGRLLDGVEHNGFPASPAAQGAGQ